MKKVVIAIGFACAVFSVFAAEMSAAEKAARHQRMLEHTGGIVTRPGTGKIVVVDAQSKIATSVIEEIVEKLKFQTKLTVECVKSQSYEMYVRPVGASAAIVLADEPALPLSVVAVENVWGLVNVAKLGDVNVDRRFVKEFVRVSTLAFGGAISQFVGSPLNTATDATMLDKFVCDNYTIDNATSIIKNLGNLGVLPYKNASYRKACQEGWAPAPTNDYQKVIWEELHAKPTNPLKIKFDKAKGE